MISFKNGAKLAVMAFTLTAALGPTAASARPYNDVQRYYFDAEGNEVGTFYLDCTGVSTYTGVTSPIYYQTLTPCDEYPHHPE